METFLRFKVPLIIFVNYHILSSHLFPNAVHNCQTEIYRIVSQRQFHDLSKEEATICPNKVETINVKPSVNSESVRKQCCNS